MDRKQSSHPDIKQKVPSIMIIAEEINCKYVPVESLRSEDDAQDQGEAQEKWEHDAETQNRKMLIDIFRYLITFW